MDKLSVFTLEEDASSITLLDYRDFDFMFAFDWLGVGSETIRCLLCCLWIHKARGVAGSSPALQLVIENVAHRGAFGGGKFWGTITINGFRVPKSTPR